MKVHNFCFTYQKVLFWSGQQTQTLQQWGKTDSFAQQVNIECAIQGKTSNFESSGGICPKIHVPKFCSIMKNELWRPHKSHTFGRTTKVVMPRLVQSFFLFCRWIKIFYVWEIFTTRPRNILLFGVRKKNSTLLQISSLNPFRTTQSFLENYRH